MKFLLGRIIVPLYSEEKTKHSGGLLPTRKTMMENIYLRTVNIFFPLMLVLGLSGMRL